MKYCQRCGSQVPDEAVVCPACGNGASEGYTNPTQNYSAPTSRYCPKCGEEIHPEAVVCMHCGCSTETKKIEEDVPSTALCVLSFLYPIVGIIFYAIKSKETPISAKKYLNMAVISIVVSIAVSVLMVVGYIVFAVILGAGAFAMSGF